LQIFNKDGREFVRGLLEGIRPICFTQVVMNLPLDAVEFLDVFVGAFSRDFWETRTLPKIHVYGFSKATDPELDYSKVSPSLCSMVRFWSILEKALLLVDIPEDTTCAEL
jgi:tRNA G37 N-methylase Trm5